MEPLDGFALSRAIDQILVEARDESFVRLLKRLRSIEMAHINEHKTDAMIVTETKRRVAEVRLHVSITKTNSKGTRIFDATSMIRVP